MACIQQRCSSCGAKRFAEIDVRCVVPERSFLCVMCQTRMAYVEMQVNLETYITSIEKTEVGGILLGQKL
jgi:rubredoxin